MNLNELYLNTNKLNQLDPELKSHFLYLHKKMVKLYSNYMKNMSQFTQEQRVHHPYHLAIVHITENLVKHDILVSDREFNIDELLTD
jgi:hypothetical protein